MPKVGPIHSSASCFAAKPQSGGKSPSESQSKLMTTWRMRVERMGTVSHTKHSSTLTPLRQPELHSPETPARTPIAQTKGLA